MKILFLTCKDEVEADKISMALLNRRLIACVRRWPVQSSFWWDKKIQHETEIILMMESIGGKFEEIESLIGNLHSYDEFVLSEIDVDTTTPGVKEWLQDTLG